MTGPRHLRVLLHGEQIGTLTRIGSDRTVFAFSDDYVDRAERPTLSLSFKDVHGSLITDVRPKTLRLHPFFSNLLPEGHLRTYLAERAGVDPKREFFLLAELGQDLAGAVRVVPEVEATAEIPEEPDDGPLRFSLAGVELKFSALNEASGGLTIPVTGSGGDWIVKLPSQRFPQVPEVEYAMLLLAERLGIRVPEARLIDVAEVGNLPRFSFGPDAKALAVKRFDRRDDGGAIHIEDFAQVFGQYPEEKYGSASYANIAAVLASECPEDIPEFVRRLVFSTLIGNADHHLKNWSLEYRDPVRPRLAPAYDLLPTVAYVADPRAALTYSRTRHFDRVDADELAHLANRARTAETPVLEAARECVARFREEWTGTRDEFPLPGFVARAIDAQVDAVPLYRE